MYAFSTHRIWSSVVLRPVLMAGMATFTIVVSSRIMKKPVVKTNRTSHGLVRAWAMPSPQPLSAGIDSDGPLQPAFCDFALQLSDPGALGVEHRDLVLELDEGEPGDAVRPQLAHDPRELVDGRSERLRPLSQPRGGRRGVQVMHEHQARGEMGIVALGPGQDL